MFDCNHFETEKLNAVCKAQKYNMYYKKNFDKSTEDRYQLLLWNFEPLNLNHVFCYVMILV